MPLVQFIFTAAHQFLESFLAPQVTSVCSGNRYVAQQAIFSAQKVIAAEVGIRETEAALKEAASSFFEDRPLSSTANDAHK